MKEKDEEPKFRPYQIDFTFVSFSDKLIPNFDVGGGSENKK